jgi:hypothetical protein
MADLLESKKNQTGRKIQIKEPKIKMSRPTTTLGPAHVNLAALANPPSGTSVSATESIKA